MFNSRKSRMSGWIATICMSTSTLFPVNSFAQDIVLQSKTGNVRVEGILAEFDGEFYRVKTDLGVLTIDGRTVDCTGDACPSMADMVSRFTVVGSGDLGQVFLPALLEAFAGSQGYRITASNISPKGQTLSISGGMAQSIAEINILVKPEKEAFAALAGEGDLIVAASRLPTGPEIARIKAADQGDPLQGKHQQVLAVDGVIAAVSQLNPLDTIRMADLVRILRGEIANWREIGGPDVEISLYLPKNTPAFARALKNSPLEVTLAQVSNTAQRFSSLAEVSDKVAGDPYGLALTSYSNLRSARPLGLQGPCHIYSMPSVFTLKSGGYPLVFKHFLFRPKARLPLFAREFLEFAKSDQAQNVVRNVGYGDLGITALPVNEQGMRLINAFEQAGKEVPLPVIKDLMRLQNGAKRLSTTFRFNPGSKILNNQSRQNAELLVAGLILGNYADKQVHIVGFSDAAGDSAQNIIQAKQRAQSVLDALIKVAPDGSLDDVNFNVSGFGEASPLACGDTQIGKQTNQRVEIWIKDARN